MVYDFPVVSEVLLNVRKLAPEITPTTRRYPVVKAWLLGQLGYMLESTSGADYDIMAVIKRVKENKVTWRGKLPCRDWTKK